MKKGDKIYIVGLDSWNKSLDMEIPLTVIGTKYIKARIPQGMELVFELKESPFRGYTLMHHKQVGPYRQWAAFEDRLIYKEWKERQNLEDRVKELASSLMHSSTLVKMGKEQLEDIVHWTEIAMEEKR